MRKESKLSTELDIDIDVELDASGLQCPMPLLKLKQQLNKMQKSQVIRVTTTDAGSVRDFGAFVNQVGHTLLLQEEGEERIIFVIRKEV